VVGFDLAGPEAGFPPDDHLAACLVAREGGLGLTIHAGEGAGPNSVWRAVARCGAARVGHGVRIVEDTVRAGGEIVALGPVAAMVRDRRIPLEVAVESNVGTGLYPDAAAHPLGALRRAGFAVTINTDNRLMSRTGRAAEFATAAAHHGFGIEELRAATEIAVLAGFAPWPERRRLLAEVIRPAYEAAGSPSSAGAGSGAPA
jgi:adenosine deaminase